MGFTPKVLKLWAYCSLAHVHGSSRLQCFRVEILIDCCVVNGASSSTRRLGIHDDPLKVGISCPHDGRWECSLKGRETWLLALLVDIIFHRRLLLFQLIFQAEITFTSATETLPMHRLRRADARGADATKRWHNNKHKYRHPIDHQMRKARNKFNYINPFFYLRNIKNNLKSVVTGRRWTQTTNGHNTRV